MNASCRRVLAIVCQDRRASADLWVLLAVGVVDYVHGNSRRSSFIWLWGDGGGREREHRLCTSGVGCWTFGV